MGVLDRFRRENRAVPGEVEFEDSLLTAILDPTKVTKQIALQIPTVAGGIDLIANVIAETPIKLYRDDNGQAIEVRDDRRLFMLNDETGDTLNANEFWRAMIRDYYLGKGGYAYINREMGRIKSIHYVDEEYVSIQKNVDPIFKAYTLLVYGQTYYPYDFIKVLRNTKDGAQGVPITIEQSQLLGTMFDTLKYEGNLVKKGGTKRGYLKATKKVTQEALDNIKDAFRSLYSGSDESVIVLNDGLEFQEASSTSVEMQLDQNKKANADDFARLFHISPELMAGQSDDISALAKLAAIPLMKTIECALNRDLLLEREKPDYYFAFDKKELLKGDMTSRFNAYKTALDANFMQIDEVRYAEDLEPLGLDWIKLGLNDVLYDPKTKTIYTPNTNQTSVMGEQSMPATEATEATEETEN